MTSKLTDSRPLSESEEAELTRKKPEPRVTCDRAKPCLDCDDTVDHEPGGE